ncbi:Fc.00g010450.m01.CDS01 [Cosmosporella sp. VM-42]
MAILDEEFIDSLAELGKPFPRFKWYLTVIVAQAALNYPEEIPSFYTILLKKYILEDKKFEETRKIREALTKMCGIQGAAKTGNALRALASAVPQDLRDSTNYREHDIAEIAIPRGRALHERIYGPNVDYDNSATISASPDYFHIARDLLYGHVFSFDKILDDLETGQAIVSCLIGIDCQEQLGNHMKGMMFNGAKREEIEMIRETCIRVAERLDVNFKTGPVPIPDA